ncbi:hypothetical protein [Sphingomonas sp. CLY1604]|uniref:hypothetical protein n=1 Tax=Sphingomonas sp. CLY1604 TaxID=3457786 RepID=UPI003FD873AC
MNTNLTPERVERWIADQTQLATLATCPEVRAMHLDLASLYRAQLGYLIAAHQLNHAPALPMAA